jgi:LDH2 family malate/lactate/ureidoglycolate dehydrogenase
MTILIRHAELCDFLVGVLEGFGADSHQARIACEALVWSDLIGRTTHGVWRFPSYVKRFRQGLLKSPCSPDITVTSASTLRIDGDGGFGHYLGHLAVEQAVSQARSSGVSVATVRNSNHFGTAGYYVDKAANSEMLGIAVSNSIAKVAPAGGVAPVFGTNPFAFAAPRKNARPILLDMATSAVSGGSVIRARQKNEKLPEGVLVDRDGKYITDAALADDGVMLPFGGAKGAGLSLLVELLSGVIADAKLSTEVRSMFNDFSGNGDNGHCFIVIDIGKLLPIDEYYERIEQLVAIMKSSAVSTGDDVRLPGESRWKIMEKRLADGVPLESELVTELVDLAAAANVELPGALLN